MADAKQEAILAYANKNNTFTKHNGIFITEITDDYAIVEHEVTPDSMNIFDVVHGGLIATMIDLAGGAMARSAGRTYVTSSMEVKFISNVGSGKLVARAELINRGRRLCNVFVKVTAEDGKRLIASGTGTYFCTETE